MFLPTLSEQLQYERTLHPKEELHLLAILLPYNLFTLTRAHVSVRTLGTLSVPTSGNRHGRPSARPGAMVPKGKSPCQKEEIRVRDARHGLWNHGLWNLRVLGSHRQEAAGRKQLLFGGMFLWG